MRTIQTMIGQEVLVCVSSLVSTLAQGYGHSRDSRDLLGLTEQAFELASSITDFESAAIEAGWAVCNTGCARFINEAADDISGSDSWEVLCDEQFIEPHEREVFEHWAVTDWFAAKLEAAGEKVDHDFAGMCVWARTTTGQAIYADAVIERIYAETHRAEA